MSKPKCMILILLPLLIIMGGYFILSGSREADLEKELLSTAETKITSIGQYAFGSGGLALIGQDEQGDGQVATFTKLPGMRYYIKTGSFHFSQEDLPVYIIGKSWAGTQGLSFSEGRLIEKSKPKGMGYAKDLLFWISVSGLISMTIFLTNRVAQRKRQRS